MKEFLDEAYIVDALRTPFGKYGGSLSSIRTDDLATLPIKHITKKYSNIDWMDLSEVILGCANQSGEDNRNVARMASLLSKLPVEVPAFTVNRLCASGLEAIAIAARNIKIKDSSLIIAGGIESMSRAPFVVGKSTNSFDRQIKIEDTTLGWRFVNPIMKKLYGIDSMAETAENVARDFNISREDQDIFALGSQEKAANAQSQGYFDNELIEVSIPQKKGESISFTKDEHLRLTSIDKLNQLKSFVCEDGSITAGNSSGINDGACALLLANRETVDKYSLTPLVRIVASTSAGVSPRIMGVGPVPAVKKILTKTGLSIDDMDVIEFNEAFASQCLAVMKELNIPYDSEKVNPNGGAIAIGHPLGASGARIVTTAIYELMRKKGKYALCSMCVGVGQGVAMILERV